MEEAPWRKIKLEGWMGLGVREEQVFENGQGGLLEKCSLSTVSENKPHGPLGKSLPGSAKALR